MTPKGIEREEEFFFVFASRQSVICRESEEKAVILLERIKKNT